MSDEIVVFVSKDGELWKTITAPIENGVARIAHFFWKEEDLKGNRIVTLDIDDFIPMNSTKEYNDFLDDVQSLESTAKGGDE